MSKEIADAFKELNENDDLRVGIITAEGSKIFSAGWDLKALNEGDIKLDQWWDDGDYGEGGFAGLTENWSLNKPVIGALNGLVIGGGFEIAMACDLLIASDHIEFGLPEIPLGIVPDAGALQRLPKLLHPLLKTPWLRFQRSMFTRQYRWQKVTHMSLLICVMGSSRHVA